MPIQLAIWERRDGGSRETMGNTALEMCRLRRRSKGINSARFYWSGSEEIVFLMEGEAAALDAITGEVTADFARLGFVMADNARLTLYKRLMDPQVGLQSYRLAGR